MPILRRTTRGDLEAERGHPEAADVDDGSARHRLGTSGRESVSFAAAHGAEPRAPSERGGGGRPAVASTSGVVVRRRSGELVMESPAEAAARARRDADAPASARAAAAASPASARGRAAVTPGAEPRRTTAKMAAVRPEVEAHAPPASGRMLDHHDFNENDGAEPLSLELTTLPTGQASAETMAGGPLSTTVHFSPRVGPPPLARTSREMRAVSVANGVRDLPPPAPPPDPDEVTRVVRYSAAVVAPPSSFARRPGIVAFSGFGIVPTRLTDAPAYALRVLSRRRVLNAGLAVARAQRPQDVDLYESALATADPATMARGIALMIAVVLAGIVGVVCAVVWVL